MNVTVRFISDLNIFYNSRDGIKYKNTEHSEIITKLFMSVFKNKQTTDNYNFNKFEFSHKIAFEISKICSDPKNVEIKETIEKICINLFKNFLKTPENCERHKDDLVEILQLAMANGSTIVCNNCLKQLNEKFGLIISAQSNKTLSIKIENFENLDVSKIQQAFEIGRFIPISLELAPKMNSDVHALLEYTRNSGMLISSLNLSGLGNKITDDNLKELISNCPNLKNLSISSKVLESIDCLKNLLTLDLSGCSGLTEFSVLNSLTSLISLNLSGVSLEEIPDLSRLSNLRTLNLARNHMEEISSVQFLSKLENLDLSDCTNLDNIPSLDSLICLKNLNLSKCESLEQIFGLKSKELLTLDLSSCKNLLSVPDLNEFQQLTSLKLNGCIQIKNIPNLNALKALTTLNISNCRVTELPELNELQQLKVLNLSSCRNIKSLPELNLLKNLTLLNLAGCQKLESIPDLSPLNNLEILNFIWCESLTSLPNLDCIKDVSVLNFTGCVQLEELPDLSQFKNLIVLDLTSCHALKKFPNLIDQHDLQTINLSECRNLETLPDLSLLKNLTTLDMAMCDGIVEIKSLNGLSELTTLIIGCKNLRHLPDLDSLVKLNTLRLTGSTSLEELPKITELIALENLFLSECELLTELSDLSDTKSLKVLDLSGCAKIERLPALNSLKNLMIFNLSGCELIKNLNGLEELVELRTLSLASCKNLKPIPDLNSLVNLTLLNLSDTGIRLLPFQPRNLTGLHELNLSNNMLTELPEEIGSLTDLSVLNLSGNQITELPEEMRALDQVRTLEDAILDGFLDEIRGPLDDYLIDEEVENALELIIQRENLAQCALEMITRLGLAVGLGHSGLRVTFENEKGADEGGLSREFLADIFQELALQCFDEGYPDTGKISTVDPQLLLEGVGKLIAFVLRTRGRYPLGNVFARDVFVALQKCKSTIAALEFENLTGEQLTALIGPQFQRERKIEAVVKFVNAKTIVEAEQYIDEAAVLISLIDDDFEELLNNNAVLDETKLTELQALAVDMLKESFTPKAKAMFWVASGFSSFGPVWQRRRRLTIEFMMNTVHGVMDHEKILAALKFDPDNDLRPELKQAFREWLENADQDQLKSFLKYATGSTGMGFGREITIRGYDGNGVAAHSCTNTLDIPHALTPDGVKAELDALQGESGGNFNMA